MSSAPTPHKNLPAIVGTVLLQKPPDDRDEAEYGKNGDEDDAEKSGVVHGCGFVETGDVGMGRLAAADVGS